MTMDLNNAFPQHQETTSEAVKNYAGAALLVGMAFAAIGVGIGFITGGRKPVAETPTKK
jgi:hypothetical protein